MLVLQKAVKMVWNLPEVMRVSYVFMFAVLLWMALWSFGAAGVVASNLSDGGRWWLLVVRWQVLLLILYVLFWTSYASRLLKLFSPDYTVITFHACRFSL
jgi:hypothetical protein